MDRSYKMGKKVDDDSYDRDTYSFVQNTSYTTKRSYDITRHYIIINKKGKNNG